MPVAVPVAVPVSGLQTWTPPALPSFGSPVLGLQSWTPPGGGPIAALGAGPAVVLGTSPFATTPLSSFGTVSPFNFNQGFGSVTNEADLIAASQLGQTGPFSQLGLNTGAFQNARDGSPFGTFQQLQQTLPQVTSSQTAPVTGAATTSITSANGAPALNGATSTGVNGATGINSIVPPVNLPSGSSFQIPPVSQVLPSVGTTVPLSQPLVSAVGTGSIPAFPSVTASSIQSPLITQGSSPFTGGPLGSFP